MMERGLISLCATLVLLVLASCTRTEQPTGTVTLTFTTSEVVTRATTPGDGDPEDGGGIFYTGNNPDLVILLENSSHSIVKRYLGANTADATASFVEDTKQKRLQVKFTSVPAGKYTVYAVANTELGNSSWFSTTVDFSTIGASSLSSLQFKALTGTDAPAVTDRMPLSAKGTLTVQSTGNGSVSLELLRCVAKVTVKFKNVTGGTLSLSDINFSITDMNPKWGYLIPPAGTDSPTAAADFRSLLMSNSGSVSILESGTEIPGTYYVFPSQAQGGIYYCSASFDWTLDKGGGSVDSDTYSSSEGLRVFDKNFEDVPALLRNQHLTIEVRIGEGSDVSFNFIVGDWEERTESVEFN